MPARSPYPLVTHHTDNVYSEVSQSAFSAYLCSSFASHSPSPLSSPADCDVDTPDYSSQQQELHADHTRPLTSPSSATSQDAARSPSCRSRSPTRSHAVPDAPPVNDFGTVFLAQYPRYALHIVRHTILCDEVFGGDLTRFLGFIDLDYRTFNKIINNISVTLVCNFKEIKKHEQWCGQLFNQFW